MNKYNYDKIKSDAFQRMSDIITAINKGATDELESLVCSSLYADTDNIPHETWYTRISDTEFIYRGNHFVLVYIEELGMTITFIKDIEDNNIHKLIVPYLWVYGFPDDLFNNVLNSAPEEQKLNLDKWIDAL